MAAPSYVNAGTGATDAGGAWSYTCQASEAAGRVFIVQILQDGGTSGALTSIVGTNIEALNGTDNTWTAIAVNRPVGNVSQAYQHLYIGRALSTSAPTISGANSTSEDVYIRSYQFSGVSTGTTLAAVAENGLSIIDEGYNTTALAYDIMVVTNGTDRLALNFVAVNDDNAIAQFSGQTGGTWVEVAEYADSGGTDGAIQMQYATMAAAGTIDGGTASITDSDSWGVVGFALIGTTASYTTQTGSFAANAVIMPRFAANAAIEIWGDYSETWSNNWTSPGVTASFASNAVIKATITPAGGKKADAVLFKNSGTKTFTADAIVKRTMPIAGATFTANAIVRRTFTPTFTANAVLKRTQTGATTVNAVTAKTASSTFAANAVIKRTQLGSFPSDAIRLRTQTATFTANAVIFSNSGTKTFAADATVWRTFEPTFAANAVIKREQTGSFAANAVLKRTQNPTSTVDAIRKRTFYFGSGPDPR